jgi:hypothetical protein
MIRSLALCVHYCWWAGPTTGTYVAHHNIIVSVSATLESAHRCHVAYAVVRDHVAMPRCCHDYYHASVFSWLLSCLLISWSWYQSYVYTLPWLYAMCSRAYWCEQVTYPYSWLILVVMPWRCWSIRRDCLRWGEENYTVFLAMYFMLLLAMYFMLIVFVLCRCTAPRWPCPRDREQPPRRAAHHGVLYY